MEKWIPLEECADGYLYRIESRNLSLGVFSAEKQGFVGIRTKFGHRYLFTEYHWDTGPPFGTVKPLDCITQCLIPLQDEDDLFEWLDGWLQAMELF